MSAEIARAAERLRQVAESATPGPWITYPTTTRADDSPVAHTISRPYNDDCPAPGGGCTPHCGSEVLRVGAEECDDDYIGAADAAFIATMHPGVSLALAAWLESVAEQGHESDNGAATMSYDCCTVCRDDNGGNVAWPCPTVGYALDVARQVLGETR